MSTQITTAFVKQFTSGVKVLAQQKRSRLMPNVRVETLDDGDRAFFDQVGSVTATKVTSRHGDTPLTDTPHSRRMVVPSFYAHADLVDKADDRRTLNQMSNPYMRVFGAAFGRAIDQAIIDVAFASASTGVDGGTSTAHPGGDFQIAASGTGMTIAKINAAKKALDEAENDVDEGPYVMVCSADQVEDLMNDSTATSADYNSVRLLNRGEINTWGGFMWVRSELLGATGSNRRCIAYAKNSLLLGVSANPRGRMSERADKNYSLQVYMEMDIGATRMDETGVVEVLCAE